VASLFRTSKSLIFLEFNNATNSLKSLLSFIGLRERDQFAQDVQPLFRRERLVVFKISLVGFGKGTENAGDFFHRESLTDCPPVAQEIFGALNDRDASPVIRHYVSRRIILLLLGGRNEGGRFAAHARGQ
jgi:hypothetical protein